MRLTFSSPVPPLECLSMMTDDAIAVSAQSTTSPESRIASVKAAVSVDDMPFKNEAIAKAAICPSETVPLPIPWTNSRISA
jgi:hypothetical protein